MKVMWLVLAQELSLINITGLKTVKEKLLCLMKFHHFQDLVSENKTRKFRIIKYPFTGENDMILIRRAMNVIEKYSCILFKPRKDEKDYINVISGAGCYSYIGKQGGKQILSLKKIGCLSRGTVQHEFIHALGFDHMQNHPKRDDYININWENIDKKEKSNFNKVSTTHYFDYNTEYDYYSVMHYNLKSFAINKNDPTITPKNRKYNKVIGQMDAVSKNDIRRINRMYNCEGMKYS